MYIRDLELRPKFSVYSLVSTVDSYPVQLPSSPSPLYLAYLASTLFGLCYLISIYLVSYGFPITHSYCSLSPFVIPFVLPRVSHCTRSGPNASPSPCYAPFLRYLILVPNLTLSSYSPLMVTRSYLSRTSSLIFVLAAD